MMVVPILLVLNLVNMKDWYVLQSKKLKQKDKEASMVIIREVRDIILITPIY